MGKLIGAITGTNSAAKKAAAATRDAADMARARGKQKACLFRYHG